MILLMLSLFPALSSAVKFCDNGCVANGYFCVGDDPTAFTVCSAGTRYGPTYCQAGLWWDSVRKVCNWPASIASPQCSCTSTLTTTSAKTTLTTKPSTTSNPTSTSGFSTSTFSSTSAPQPTNFQRVCYFTNWAVYRYGPASYTAGNIDPFMCTHVIVAFMNLNQGQISYLEAADPETLSALTKMRDTKNPSLKVLVAIGGWNAGSWPFIEVVNTTTTQDNFITQVISFLRQNNLDGLDIDWEYPQGYISQFSTWMQKLRYSFEAEARHSGKNRLLLTAAVAAGQGTIDWAYDVPKLSAAVDMINIMSYDLNGPWSAGMGLNAGLYPQFSGDTLNIQWAANYWARKGADTTKLIIGIPLYSRVMKICNPGPTQTAIGAKTCGTGAPGPYTVSAGFEAYYESCLKLQCVNGNWTSVWSKQGMSPYMYNSGNQWISYENATSIAAKVEYAKTQGYGGVMVWALDLDDFRDLCGSGVRYPLMSTLVAVATGQSLPTFNETPKPSVNPCDPTGSGDSSSIPAGTTVDLNLCDNQCAVDGIYCVPDNAQAFYQCLAGVRYSLQYCSSALKYNYVAKACDWPANYPGCNCVLPTTSTTTATTITTTASTSTDSLTETTTSSSETPSSSTTDIITAASTSTETTESSSSMTETTESVAETSTQSTTTESSTTSSETANTAESSTETSSTTDSSTITTTAFSSLPTDAETSTATDPTTVPLLFRKSAQKPSKKSSRTNNRSRI